MADKISRCLISTISGAKLKTRCVFIGRVALPQLGFFIFTRPSPLQLFLWEILGKQARYRSMGQGEPFQRSSLVNTKCGLTDSHKQVKWSLESEARTQNAIVVSPPPSGDDDSDDLHQFHGFDAYNFRISNSMFAAHELYENKMNWCRRSCCSSVNVFFDELSSIIPYSVAAGIQKL